MKLYPKIWGNFPMGRNSAWAHGMKSEENLFFRQIFEIFFLGGGNGTCCD